MATQPEVKDTHISEEMLDALLGSVAPIKT